MRAYNWVSSISSGNGQLRFAACARLKQSQTAARESPSAVAICLPLSWQENDNRKISRILFTDSLRFDMAIFLSSARVVSGNRLMPGGYPTSS
jgi:hypothetical protein